MGLLLRRIFVLLLFVCIAFPSSSQGFSIPETSHGWWWFIWSWCLPFSIDTTLFTLHPFLFYSSHDQTFATEGPLAQVGVINALYGWYRWKASCSAGGKGNNYVLHGFFFVSVEMECKKKGRNFAFVQFIGIEWGINATLKEMFECFEVIRIQNYFQVGKLFTSKLFFHTPSLMIAGIVLLYYARWIERRFGSKKFMVLMQMFDSFFFLIFSIVIKVIIVINSIRKPSKLVWWA